MNPNINQGLLPRMVYNSLKPDWMYGKPKGFLSLPQILDQITGKHYSVARNPTHTFSFWIRSYSHFKKLSKNIFSILSLSLQIFFWQKSPVNFTGRPLKGNRTLIKKKEEKKQTTKWMWPRDLPFYATTQAECTETVKSAGREIKIFTQIQWSNDTMLQPWHKNLLVWVKSMPCDVTVCALVEMVCC